jgi:secondary thiamine-phosphate synthase enzyme
LNKQYSIKITSRGPGIHDITSEILDQLSLPSMGVIHLFLQHTSAGLAITENSSPSVWKDLTKWLHDLAPESKNYLHDEEGPDDMPAHLKSLLTGQSIQIPIQNHKLALGKWQGIFLFEFRNAAPDRNIIVTLIS